MCGLKDALDMESHRKQQFSRLSLLAHIISFLCVYILDNLKAVRTDVSA